MENAVIKIERYGYYLAKLDIKKPVKEDYKLKNGEIIKVMAGWMIDDFQPYNGQFAMIPSDDTIDRRWMPEEDLIFIKEIPFEEYSQPVYIK